MGGGAHVGFITDASFPTWLLSHWGRDRASGRQPVQELVRRYSSDPARAVGLLDRGVIKPGMKADLNVIDFNALAVEKPCVCPTSLRAGSAYCKRPAAMQRRWCPAS
jgi:N-acyl-D-aspartate/D-glutamate deacylase